MTAQSKTTIKSYFETGDKPTQAQFIDLIDSYRDIGTPVSAADIEAGAVTVSALASAAVTGVAIASAAVRAEAIASAAVTSQALSPTMITGLVSAATAAADSFIFSDASDSGNLKRDTVQGLLDLVPNRLSLIGTEEADGNGSTLTITGLDSTYDTYAIAISNLRPATDGAGAYLRAGDSAGIDSGATDYAYVTQAVVAGVSTFVASSSTGATQIILANNIGNATGEGVGAILFLHRPADGLLVPSFSGTISIRNNNGEFSGGAVIGWHNSVITLDRLQVLFSAGNIATGRLTVWGMNHA